MSIVKMNKFSLVAHKRDKGKILRTLTRIGTVEVVKSDAYENTDYNANPRKKEAIVSKLVRINFALSFIKTITNQYARIDKKAPKVNFKRENKLTSFNEFESITNNEFDLMNGVTELEDINSQLTDLKTEQLRLKSLFEQVALYNSIDIPFSQIKDTTYTTKIVGTLPASKVDQLRDSLPQDIEFYAYPSDKLTAILIIAHITQKTEILSLLALAEFVKCAFEYELAASDVLKSLEAKSSELDNKKSDLMSQARLSQSIIPELKMLYDYYLLEQNKVEVSDAISETSRAFVLEGWIPEKRGEELKQALATTTNTCEVFLRDAIEGEIPPTCTTNNYITSAFSEITAMYGQPNYTERDPSNFVALFYFIFFGMMISDAGYGLLMTIACFSAYKIIKPVKNTGKMMLMFGFCGISTILWGTLFGGWFGIDTLVLQGSAFGRFLLSISWFNPLEEPLIMFGLALGLGIIQIATGFVLNGISKFKVNPLDGILNDFSWVAIFMGLGIYIIGSVTIPVVKTIGLVFALVGLAMLLAGGAIGKKSFPKMILGALKNLYGSINVVSDILSYSRLFGLGLTTGVIGLVVNKLGEIIVTIFFGGSPVGWIVAAPVLIFGHAFNLAINLLGAYVHNSRLQYIEFFSRFYGGSGRAFVPFGSKTKYIYLDN